MDFRKFLDRKEELVLPYLGGPSVISQQRRLRLSSVPPEPGWWRFECAGRSATALARVEPPEELTRKLPAVRGHLACGWLFAAGSAICRVQLMPQEEPAALAPCIARRWYDGSLLFEAFDWEQEPEELARVALEQQQPIRDVKGVPATLRAAFGYALLQQAAADLAMAASPHEVRGQLRAIAEQGRAQAEQVLLGLGRRRAEERERRLGAAAAAALRRQDERAAELALHAVELAERAGSLPRQPPRSRATAAAERAAAALAAAGGRLAGFRLVDGASAEATFYFMDERFICLVHPASLQVIDAGICLSGADEQVNLRSLPAVIREAIETGQLCITRS